MTNTTTHGDKDPNPRNKYNLTPETARVGVQIGKVTSGVLHKTNMVLNGFEGKEKTEAKGVMYVELTVGSKTLATAFFVAEVQGNYNVILGRDWVHANQCVPSTMHQFLIQWVDDEVEVIHADNSACVADRKSVV